MSRIALSNTGDWKLEFPDDQDVRGYRVLDKKHNNTGLVVEDMIVDTDQKMIDAVVFSDGTEYPARDLSIGDGVVYATADTIEGTRRAGDMDRFGSVKPSTGREYSDDVIVEYDPDYRKHYASTYESSDRNYDDDLVHAYRYGTETAHNGDYRNRAYLDAEDDLRTGYTARHGDRDFDADRDAIRYGYNRARGSY
jgi:hypothetical protein